MAATKIVIATWPKDTHALVICAALMRKGLNPIRVILPSFPSTSNHEIYIGDSSKLIVDGDALGTDDDAPHAVWMRRPRPAAFGRLEYDDRDKKFLEGIYREYGQGFWYFLSTLGDENIFWVNPLHGRLLSRSKTAQLHLARECGFVIPHTLVTNNHKEFLAFYRKHRTVICKAFCVNTWSENGQRFTSYSALIEDASQVRPDSLRLQPAIFQQFIPKAYELRVTVFGGRAFAMKIDSQIHEAGYVDWRGIPQSEMRCEMITLPDNIAKMCFDLMRRLNLEFGAFDLIVGKDGRYVFIEVNEAGQFLFCEELEPKLLLTDAFAHFLQHRNLNAWAPSGDSLQLREVESSAIFSELLRKDHELMSEIDFQL